MTCTITSPRIQRLLNDLYADAEKSPLSPRAGGPQPPYPRGSRELFHALRHVYMAIGPEFGKLLYTLVRTSRSRNIVEFGTSMGISTIFLAAGLQDNGGGQLITTEFEPEKITRARQNLSDAGLVELVQFRIGDAYETLQNDMPQSVDFLFLDGAKEMYLDVLKVVEPHLRPGAIIAADNTDHDGIETYLSYVRNPAHGYASSAIQTTRDGHPSGHEISYRTLGE
ncbi:O-methyltransferase [Bremerella cremea]|uniref:O-methyltransferase n=1 Tax=Bremerella cremea TaxID=1031537 RepID=UPI0031F15D5F